MEIDLTFLRERIDRDHSGFYYQGRKGVGWVVELAVAVVCGAGVNYVGRNKRKERRLLVYRQRKNTCDYGRGTDVNGKGHPYPRQTLEPTWAESVQQIASLTA